jgi:hypothetical protein
MSVDIENAAVAETESPEIILFESNSLSEYITIIGNDTTPPQLCQYLDHLRKTIGIGKEELFARSSISSSYGHEIIKGTKHPTRNKIIQLAFGMRLELTETQKLLWLSRHATLDSLFRWDAVIIDAIEQKYTVTKTNLILSDQGLPLLFECK